MSKLDSGYVGKNHPPKEHRFSSTNQPERRRRKRSDCPSSDDLFGDLAAALSEEVTVNDGGRKRKVTAGFLLAKQIIKQGLSGSYADKMKLVILLQRSGSWDLFKAQQQIQLRCEEALEEEQKERKDALNAALFVYQLSIALLMELSKLSAEFLNLLTTGSCAAGIEEVASVHAKANRFLSCYDEEKTLWASPSAPLDGHWSDIEEDDGSDAGQGEVRGLSASESNGLTEDRGRVPIDVEADDPFYTGQLGHE